MLCAIIGFDKEDAANLRAANLKDHREHSAELKNSFAVGGPLQNDEGDRSIGSLIVAEFPDRKAVENWMSRDPLYQADREMFLQTRRLAGTPRWELAINDVKADPADLMRDFSCAMGVQLTPENAPRTATLVARAVADTGHSTAVAKDYYKRLHPFQIDQGPI